MQAQGASAKSASKLISHKSGPARTLIQSARSRFIALSPRCRDTNVNRNPEADDKIPNDGIDVDAEPLLLAVTAAHNDDKQHDSEDQVGDVIEGVQAEKGPGVRTERVRFPIEIDGVPFDEAHGESGPGEDQVQEQAANHPGTAILLRGFARPVRSGGAQDERNESEAREQSMRKLVARGRPHIHTQAHIEVRRDEDGEHRTFDEVDEELSPPERRLTGSFPRAEMADVKGARFGHGSSSSGRRGQNQPIRQIPVRIEPQVTYHALKTEPANPIVTATAVRNGQMLGGGST